MHVCLLLFLSVTILLLLMEMAATGWEILFWRICSHTAEAVVVENRIVLEPRSKGLVECSVDGTQFERISSTEDREVGYLPILFFLTEKTDTRPFCSGRWTEPSTGGITGT